MFPKFNIGFLFLVLIKKFFKLFALFSLKLRVNPVAAFHSLKRVVTEKTALDPFLFLRCAQGKKEKHSSMSSCSMRNSDLTYIK